MNIPINDVTFLIADFFLGIVFAIFLVIRGFLKRNIVVLSTTNLDEDEVDRIFSICRESAKARLREKEAPRKEAEQ